MNSSETQKDAITIGVAEIIRKSLADSGDTAVIRPETSLIDDLDLDSVTMVDVMLDLEDHFHVQLSDGELRSASTVKDVEMLIQRKTQQSPPPKAEH